MRPGASLSEVARHYGIAARLLFRWKQELTRTFSEADKRRIIEEAMRPGASLSEVARHYGIAARLLFRWKQELTMFTQAFVSVEITDGLPPAGEQVP